MEAVTVKKSNITAISVMKDRKIIKMNNKVLFISSSSPLPLLPLPLSSSSSSSSLLLLVFFCYIFVTVVNRKCGDPSACTFPTLRGN
jgi:hypothetical protein